MERDGRLHRFKGTVMAAKRMHPLVKMAIGIVMTVSCLWLALRN